MSTLAVNTITAETGNTVSLASGKSLNASQGLTTPTGHIIQVVHSKRAAASGRLSYATGSQSTFSNALGMVVNITPASTSSTMLIKLAFRYSSNQSSDNVVRIVRTVGGVATNFYPVDTSGGLGNIYYANGQSNTYGADKAYEDISFEWLDSPSTAAQITYQVQFANGAGTLSIGCRGDNANFRDNTITVMEIAG
mgnify:CR=1 FL=1